MWPPKHSRTRYASFKRPSLPFRHGFVEPIEGGIRCCSTNIVGTRENSQGREAYLGELPATRADRLRRRRHTTLLMAFRIGQGKRRANNSRWSCWRSWQRREVFFELSRYIVSVPIGGLEVD